MKTIVFVCNGNMHRSAAAEFLTNQALKKQGLESDFIAISRGLCGTGGTPPTMYKKPQDYPEAWPIADLVLQEFGVDLLKHESRPIDLEAVEQTGLIIAMDRHLLIGMPNSLVKQFPAHGYKMRLFMELAGSPDDVE